MKAERRHDLKTNALARGVEDARSPREYGSRILLVVLVAAIVFLLVRYWNDKKIRDVQMVTESLQTANSSVRELGLLPLEIRAGGSAADVAENRQRVVQHAEQSINTVLNSAKDPEGARRCLSGSRRSELDAGQFPGASRGHLPSNLQLSNRDPFMEQAARPTRRYWTRNTPARRTDVFYARMRVGRGCRKHGTVGSMQVAVRGDPRRG